MPELVPKPLAGKGAALVFEKPSARTRSSTEMAVFTLGGHPIYIRGEEVGIGQPGVARRRRPHARRLLRGPRGAGVRPRDARRPRGGVGGPGGQPAVRPRAPDAGARRPAHRAGGVRRPRRPASRVRRRRQQRRRVARVRRGALGARAGRVEPAGVRARRRRGRPRPQPRRCHRARHRAAGRGPRRRRRLHRRLDVDGPGGRGRGAARRVRGLPGRRRAHGARRTARPASCTACPRTAARRSRPT